MSQKFLKIFVTFSQSVRKSQYLAKIFCFEKGTPEATPNARMLVLKHRGILSVTHIHEMILYHYMIVPIILQNPFCHSYPKLSRVPKVCIVKATDAIHISRIKT